MKKQYLWVLVAASLVAFGAGCKKNTNDNTNENAIINQGIDLNEALDLNVNTDDLNTNESEDDDVVANTNTEVEDEDKNENSNENRNTNSSDDEDVSSSGVIKITGPEKDEELKSPFYVEGTASSGDSVYIRLKTGSTTIFTENVSVRGGEFKGKLLFDFSRTKTGTIEVFQKDSAGTEINLTSVSVTFDLESSSNENSNSNTNSTNTNTANTNTDDGY